MVPLLTRNFALDLANTFSFVKSKGCFSPLWQGRQYLVSVGLRASYLGLEGSGIEEASFSTLQVDKRTQTIIRRTIWLSPVYRLFEQPKVTKYDWQGRYELIMSDGIAVG